jgi:hypothetical protein
MKVRLRPNGIYLVAVLAALVGVVWGVRTGGAAGIAGAVGAGTLALALGYPILLSTVLRIPVIDVSDIGIRLPLLGVRLRWSEVADVRQTARTNARPDRGPSVPLLLVVPAYPGPTMKSVRPWLRSDARRNLKAYGTPVVISDVALNRSLAEIQDAVERARSAAG